MGFFVGLIIRALFFGFQVGSCILVFSDKHLGARVGRQGQMEYLNLISDSQFFISLILMYVIEHCHTIIQHRNMIQRNRKGNGGPLGAPFNFR